MRSRLTLLDVQVSCENTALGRLVEILAHPSHVGLTHQSEDHCGNCDGGSQGQHDRGGNGICPAIADPSLHKLTAGALDNGPDTLDEE